MGRSHRWAGLLLALCVPHTALAEPGDAPVPELLRYKRANAPATTYNELFVYGGPYYSDYLHSSFFFGADYVFHFSKMFGVGPSFQWLRSNYPDNNPSYNSTFIKTTSAFNLAPFAMISLPMAFRIGGTVIESKIHGIAGAGAAATNEDWSYFGFFGGGSTSSLGVPWLAFRLDVRGSIKGVPVPLHGTQVDSEMLALFGLSFQLPPEHD